jgi:hypothetical protein
MDVYHKVLLKIYEASGGRDSVDVDFVALLKREGFFPSLDSIKEQLKGESWMTDSPKPNHVRITHWGVMEARKAAGGSATDSNKLTQDSNRLLAESHELSTMLEKFAATPSADSLNKIQKKLSEMSTIAHDISNNL